MPSKLLPLPSPDSESAVHAVLSDDVVFRSPVRDYHGRADVAHILATIGEVLDQVECRHELIADGRIVTIIATAHAEHPMSGVLDERHDALGRVEQATLLLRPLSALLDAITAMRAALELSPLPSTLTL